MTRETGSRLSRRKFMAATGTGIAATALAGCSSGGGSDSSTGPLTADGSSTVYPIANKASSYWNGNSPADDGEYWGSNSEGSVPGWSNFETDKNLADYFAGKYGFEETGERSSPPYLFNVALSHSGTGVKAVQEGRVDIGNSSAPVADELPDASQETLDKYIDHVLGVDGQPVVVSREIYDAGVTQITGEQLRQIYTKDITNWSELGGPDREIQAIGRAEGSGTDTAFRANLYGDPDAPISPDVRKGQNQQVKTLIENSDNGIAYIALAFVDEDGGTPPIGVEFEGTLYEYGNNLGSKGYPLSRDLHNYTWEDTSKKEAAPIRMILTEFGQKVFVEDNNYFKLPESRRQKQRDKLPEPSN